MLSDEESAIERIKKIKEQNKKRSRKYYEKNKEAITEKRKVKRLQVQSLPTEEKKEELKLLTLQQVVRIIEALPGSKKTITTYIDGAKRLSTILDITNFFIAFNDALKVIERIEKAKTTTGKKELFSLNSKKALYQTIIKLNDLLKLNIPQKEYELYMKQFDIFKVDSKKQTKAKADDEEVMDFDEYLKDIKNAYDVGSKEYLIVELYHFRGFRDDLQFKIIQKESDADKEDNNYIVVPLDKKTNCIILLNKYKTHKRYGKFILKIPTPLTNLIKNYIESNGLEYGSFLFKEKKLSSFISKFNRKIGLPITINTLRQMRISKYHQERELTTEEEVDLAREMHHSVGASAGYRRQVTTRSKK